jgi:hypothetical protein
MKHLFLVLSIVLIGLNTQAQMGIGTATPNAAAQLDVTSTSKGFLAPRMTKTERDAITTVTSASKGLLIYQTDNTPGFYYYDGTAWTSLAGSSSAAGVDLSTAQSVGGLKTFTSNDGLLATGTHGSGTVSSLNAGTRMMWYPLKSAFRAGYVNGIQWDDVNIGNYSVAMGADTKASGDYSTALGTNSFATGQSSTAMGESPIASGLSSIAMGNYTKAIGSWSTAMGTNTEATGIASTSMGESTKAGGNYSVAMGYSTIASGISSTAMGRLTTASGYYSTAMGYLTTASGTATTTMGESSKAIGYASTAMGYSTTASGISSTAMGRHTTASGEESTSMGLGTTSESFAETVMGTFNTDYTPTSTNSYTSSDRLFVIGNGTSSSALSDALVMLKNGNTTFSGTVTATVVAPTSDIRLKRNIVPLKKGIEALMQLNPVSYEKKNNLSSNDYSIKENGFIAQELKKVMPSLVVEGTDKDKLLSVNYTAIIPILTKAIQEQQANIKSLEKNAEEQQKQIVELKKMVEQLLKK